MCFGRIRTGQSFGRSFALHKSCAISVTARPHYVPCSLCSADFFVYKNAEKTIECPTHYQAARMPVSMNIGRKQSYKAEALKAPVAMPSFLLDDGFITNTCVRVWPARRLLAEDVTDAFRAEVKMPDFKLAFPEPDGVR